MKKETKKVAPKKHLNLCEDCSSLFEYQYDSDKSKTRSCVISGLNMGKNIVACTMYKKR
jgi:hypothetical protein